MRHETGHVAVPKLVQEEGTYLVLVKKQRTTTTIIVIYIDFHSAKQAL